MISLKTIKANDERKKLKLLYMEYLHQLSQYKIFDASFEATTHEMYIDEEYREDMFIMLDDKPIGFAMIGHYPNAFTDRDIYIQEFFVKGKYQNEGYGRQAVRLIAQKYGYKDISLFVIKANQKAIDFWPNVLNKIGHFCRLKEGGIKASTCDNELIWNYY